MLRLTRSTRSIYLSLACLSLIIHLLLAFFCLSILQTGCILPLSSSSSSTRDTVPVQHGSLHSPLDAEQHQGQRPAEEDPFGRNEKKLTGGGKAEQEVKGHSKLEALFRHPLYNQPGAKLQEDDWLLRVRTSQQAQDEGQEKENAIDTDSEWWVSYTVGNHRHGALTQDSGNVSILQRCFRWPEFFCSYLFPAGGAPVRWTATKRWTGRATWTRTLLGFASTWGSLAGSCTTGGIQTCISWLITWHHSGSWALVSMRSLCHTSSDVKICLCYTLCRLGGFTTLLWVICTLDLRHSGVCSSSIT